MLRSGQGNAGRPRGREARPGWHPSSSCATCAGSRAEPPPACPPGVPPGAPRQVPDLYDPRTQWASYLLNAIKAKELFLRDTSYIVRQGEVSRSSP